MTKPQYAPGDKVRVVASTFRDMGDSAERAKSLIGKNADVKHDYGVLISVWLADKEDWVYFRRSDLEPVTPPDEIEQHGVTYVRKDRVEADTARLDWLALRPALELRFTLRSAWGVFQSAMDTIGCGQTPQDAIDAAMRAEKETGHG